MNSITRANPKIEKGWKKVLAAEFQKKYFKDLSAFLNKEKKEAPIYPPEPFIFKAFNSTPFDAVKVVILGQDPYHGPGQANGLCFSVSAGLKHPRSLVNILKELQKDLNVSYTASGDLDAWAKQGVLLLNTTLTVRQHKPASHKGKGWEEFTDVVIKTLSGKKEGIVFILWGKHAQNKKLLINMNKHFVLEAAHPSPLSVRGFFGCRHFSKTNYLLKQNKKSPINWIDF